MFDSFGRISTKRIIDDDNRQLTIIWKVSVSIRKNKEKKMRIEIKI